MAPRGARRVWATRRRGGRARARSERARVPLRARQSRRRLEVSRGSGSTSTTRTSIGFATTCRADFRRARARDATMRVVPSTPSSLRRSSELSESNASESNTGRSRCPSREPCLVSPPRAPTRVPRGNDRADVPRNVLRTTFAPSRVFDSSMPESRNRDRCGACGTKLRYRAGALRFSRSLLFAHSRAPFIRCRGAGADDGAREHDGPPGDSRAITRRGASRGVPLGRRRQVQRAHVRVARGVPRFPVARQAPLEEPRLDVLPAVRAEHVLRPGHDGRRAQGGGAHAGERLRPEMQRGTRHFTRTSRTRFDETRADRAPGLFFSLFFSNVNHHPSISVERTR